MSFNNMADPRRQNKILRSVFVDIKLCFMREINPNDNRVGWNAAEVNRLIG